eukprot:CAMPEP_0174874088 /NCGR_PEP_ID=MMETSP1114-20130205/76093_1 /TAXON_ID=312471 /ORGANISM="Neobodo designis, Strain CCAP 1951/1" /LENGTH=62 /DNA_ID=CAMNT_0016109417 /DNA_START=14 /DNA_END=198 /DNA_ORIENTATION=+
MIAPSAAMAAKCVSSDTLRSATEYTVLMKAWPSANVPPSAAIMAGRSTVLYSGGTVARAAIV